MRAAKVATRQVYRAYDPVGNTGTANLRFCSRCGAPCTARRMAGRLRPTCTECSFVHYRNLAPGVAVIVLDGDRALLGLRADDGRGARGWAFPAGFVEFDEDFLSAAHRETREETGLEIEIDGILNVATCYHARSLHALVVAVVARPVGGRLRVGGEFLDVTWVPLAGPYPPLAYEGDADSLAVVRAGNYALLPVDDRYACGAEIRSVGS